MNSQELERRFLGQFIHTLTLNEQVSWLEMQPELEQALNVRANEENWMTTPFADALDAVSQSRAQQIALNKASEQTTNRFTIAHVINGATLPQGVSVTFAPRNISLDTPLERPISLEFFSSDSLIARYNLDPKVGKGKLAASYKKFVREHLAARLANRAARA